MTSVLGVDVSTSRLAFGQIQAETGQLERHWWVGLPPDAVNRLAVAYDYATVLPGGLVIVPEDPPMVRNARVHRELCEVLGAFLAGCTHAHWVHPGMPVPSWKLATVGKGNATKGDVGHWVGETYGMHLLAPEIGNQDVWDAIAIAHAGRAWWESRERDAA